MTSKYGYSLSHLKTPISKQYISLCVHTQYTYTVRDTQYEHPKSFVKFPTHEFTYLNEKLKILGKNN